MIVRWTLRLASYGIVALTAAFVAFVGGDAWLSRSLPDLEPWHRWAPEGEIGTGDEAHLDFEGYLEREAALFAQLDSEIYAKWGDEDPELLNRYRPGSRSDPRQYEQNFNRSFERRAQPSRGSVLLVHGLSDSPYSIRALAESFHGFGYDVIGLRLPGHGTTPAGLDEVVWQDWRAAVTIATRHATRLREEAGPQARLYLVGYSTGAALVFNHVVEELLDSGATSVSGIFMLAPSLGVTRFARLANLNRIISRFEYFEKSRWVDVMPEFDPYKYGSFAKNAGRQIHLLTSHLDLVVDDLFASGLGSKIPPTMIFQSVVDATIDVTAVVSLVRRLPDEAHEIIAFDINDAVVREGIMLPAIKSQADNPFGVLELRAAHTLITNVADDGDEVEERRWSPGAAQPTVRRLGLRWPDYAFSLSHLSLPFSPDDPLYGAQPREDLPLGRLNLKGERGVLLISAGQMIRLRHNPFYAYVEERIGDAVAN